MSGLSSTCICVRHVSSQGMGTVRERVVGVFGGIEVPMQEILQLGVDVAVYVCRLTLELG